MNFIADTDVLIDFLRDCGNEARRIEFELKAGGLCTTAVSAFELWVGAKSTHEKSAVGTLLNALTIIPLDAPSAAVAGDVFRELESKGITIGMADSLIAGICLHRGFMLITRNKKHFSRIQKLKLAGEYLTSSDE